MPADREPAFSTAIPEGEDRDRRVCDTCGFIDYVNPKIVAGAVVAWSDKGPAFGPGAVPLADVRILMCKRAIEPRKGWWTLPAGFMEEGETVAEAVRREAQEEALADIRLDGVLALYDIPRRSQVQVFHRATFATAGFGVGPESLETELFAWGDIPWKSLAFHTVSWVLTAFEETRLLERFPPHSNPPTWDWMGPAAD